MGQISLMCKINIREMANCERVTASELAKQLNQDAERASAFKKGQLFAEKPGRREAKIILRKVEANLDSTFATHEGRKTYQRRAWNMAAKFHSTAMFITMTLNETRNATVAYFSGHRIVEADDVALSTKTVGRCIGIIQRLLLFFFSFFC